jgi:hypothetical protein
MAPKIVIENALLRGSQDGSVQIVARVYTAGGQEFRVIAPEHATGSALDWIGQFHVRTSSSDELFSGEIVVTDRRSASIIQQVGAELLKQKNVSEIWQIGTNEEGTFHPAQICTKGHVLRSTSELGRPLVSGEHCSQCGSVSLDACPKCGMAIRGERAMLTRVKYLPPNYCHKCGHPYPWMEDRLDTARQLLYHDEKLSIDDKNTNWELLKDVMSDPKSSTAPAKKRLFQIGIEKALPATREFLLDFLAKLGAEMAK